MMSCNSNGSSFSQFKSTGTCASDTSLAVDGEDEDVILEVINDACEIFKCLIFYFSFFIFVLMLLFFLFFITIYTKLIRSFNVCAQVIKSSQLYNFYYKPK